MPRGLGRLLLLPLWAALWLAACSDGPAPTSLAAEPSPPPSPSPAFSAPVAVSLREGPSSGEWTVLGIARTGGEALADPSLLLFLLDREGTEIGRRTVDLPTELLPPGTGWPFREVFQPPSPPESATARLQGDLALASSPAAEVAAEILGTFVDDQGRVNALGSLHTVGNSPVEILGLRLIGRTEDGAIANVVDAMAAQTILTGGTPVPFIARLPDTDEGFAWEVFPLVRPADRVMPEVSLVATVAYADDQGNPFVTAQIANPSGEPVAVRVTGILREGTAWIAGRSIEVPAPIHPGETALVSIRVPATSASGGDGAEELGWDFFLEAREAETGSIRIPAEVVAYEPAGSTLVLRVRVSAPAETRLDGLAVSAALRSEAGPVVSGAWSDGPAPDSGEEAILVLSLPLPRGFDVTASILDVTAFGLQGAP